MTTPLLTDWIGRSETFTDDASLAPARAMAATMGGVTGPLAPGSEIPPLWLWLYMCPIAPMAQLGPDGHPRLGGFLPPVPSARRMWAGSRFRFRHPIRIGDRLERVSTVCSVAEKQGRSGSLVFVTVEHVNRANGTTAMIEEQDLVYVQLTDRYAPPAPTEPPPADWSENLAVDPVLLFRFSALTFNGHRIHYDRDYATQVEHYPGLVVHGPLQAMALYDAALRREPGREPAAFSFRGLHPAFDFEQITLNGCRRDEDSLELFTATPAGGIAIRGVMTWRRG